MIGPADLAALPGVPELVARSRAIGALPTLVIHGGGNTSCKTTGRDHLGRVRPVLVIKASGTDLRTIDTDGFVALYLDDLLVARESSAMDDDQMTRFLAASRADNSARRPSIETLLHAFLPAAHVDHVHADAICALTKAPDPERIVRESLGADVAYVPYQRPGFDLAQEVARHASAEAVVLGHHGLVTWGADSESVLARTRTLVARAEEFLARRRSRPPAPSVPGLTSDQAFAVLLALRGRLSRSGRRILHVDSEGRIYADRDDVRAIIDAGPATADHLLRIRPFPIIVRGPEDVGPATDEAERRSHELWERYRSGAAPGVAMRDVRPVLALVPGLGTVASGPDSVHARVVSDVAARTHDVAATAIDAFGKAARLCEADIFDLEYWPLELAKLAPRTRRDLDGRVVIVTGAASGIGRDVAIELARLGAHVALADIDSAGLARAVEAIAGEGEAFGLRTDVTNLDDVDALVRATVLRWGGIDGAVSNAGVAVTGRIEALTDAEWDRSLAINTRSHFLLARRLLPVLADQGLGGSLVFVASKNAFSPGEGFGAYSVAKAAEVQLARVVAIEGGRTGVRANVVSPDAVFGGSHLWDHGLREERAAAHRVAPHELEGFYAGRSLLGIEVRGSDVADAVAFCLSDKSSRMTGCVLTVDGGVAAAFPR